MEDLASAVHSFRSAYAETKTCWTDEIGKARARGEKIVIWGAGSKGVAFLTGLEVHDSIEYAVDINPYKHDMYMAGTGQQIVAPEFLIEYQPDRVIAMNPVYLLEIEEQLGSLGLTPDVVAV